MTPLANGDLWSRHPTFGEQRPEVVRDIRESVAFVDEGDRPLTAAWRRPVAHPVREALSRRLPPLGA